MEAVLFGIERLADPTVILTMLAASALGLLFGAIPGLTATMAVALLVPFTFFMDPIPALVAMVTVSAMAIFAEDIPAILVELLGGISFIPAIVLFCIVGAFAINNSLFDVGVMLAMGVLGYILEVNGVPVAPVVLGLVLGPILEKNFMFSMTKSDWDMVEFFSRPVAAGLGLVTIAIWLTPIYPKLLRMVRREKAQEAGSA